MQQNFVSNPNRYRSQNYGNQASNGGYYPQPQGYYQLPQSPIVKKRSGAKSTMYEPKQGPNVGKKMVIVNAWNKSRYHFKTFTCVTTGKSKLNKETGWIGSIACTVLDKGSGQKTFYWGCMEQKTHKVVIQDLGIVINPKAKNGGYCGKFTR